MVSTSAYFSIEPGERQRGRRHGGRGALHRRTEFHAGCVDRHLSAEVAGAKAYDSLTDAYTDYVDLTAQKIEEDISGERSRIRYEQVKTEAEEALADATAEYEDAKAEAEQKLADAEKELGDGRTRLKKTRKSWKTPRRKSTAGRPSWMQTRRACPVP